MPDSKEGDAVGGRDRERDRESDREPSSNNSNNKNDEGRGKGAGKGAQTLAIPPHLITGNDYLNFHLKIREFFGEGNDDMSLTKWNQLFALVNKEISQTSEIVTVLDLKALQDIPGFLKDAKVMNYSGGVTLSNMTVSSCSSGTTTYYELPGKVFEFLYSCSDGLISVLNSFNVGAAAAMSPVLFRQLIATSQLRNHLSGPKFRDALFQGFVSVRTNTISVLIGRKHNSEEGFSVSLAMPKAMSNELYFHHVSTGAVNARTTRKYAVMGVRVAAPGGRLTELMTLRARLLAIAQPQGMSQPMGMALKMIKMAVRPTMLDPSFTRFTTFLDGGNTEVNNAQAGAPAGNMPPAAF